ncbi:MAG: hypothetical protein QW109_06065 [Sulfolobales archaeon]
MPMSGLNLIVLAVTTALTSYVLSRTVYRLEKKLGFTTIDLHKPEKNVVARSGGLAIMATLVLALSYWSVLSKLNSVVIVYTFSAILAGLIGFIDDVVHLGVRLKLLLFCLPALPPVLLHLYEPYPYIPGIGHLRLTLLYPLGAIAAYDIMANAFNMSDTHNGLIVSTFLVFATSILLSTALPGPDPIEGFETLLTIFLSVLLGYLPLNMYPAKMLNGNSGSHLIGSLAAALILTSRREFLSLMLLVPQILNGYFILFTTGLKSKEYIERPTKLKSGGIIAPNCSPKSPITLVKLFVIEREMSERELVKKYVALQVVTSAISLLLYWVLAIVKF